MASVFDDFTLHENDNIDAATLRSKTIAHSGHLMRKHKFLNFHRWSKCFVIKYNSKLYIYDKPTSLKPLLFCSLLGYERIIGEGMASSKSHAWTFTLVPLVSTMPTLTFAAESKKERTEWMLELKTGMLQAHNKCSDDPGADNLRLQVESEMSTEACFLEEPIYKDEEEATDMRNGVIDWPEDHLIQWSANSYVPTESTDDIAYYYDSAPGLYEEIVGNYGEPDSKAFYQCAMFDGDKEESLKELKRRSGVGVFLVRRHECREVLSVKTESRIVLFEIETISPDQTVRLKNFPETFETLPHLLHHYIKNNLPHRDFPLSTPYQLANLI